jgi:hypothetical protein
VVISTFLKTQIGCLLLRNNFSSNINIHKDLRVVENDVLNAIRNGMRQGRQCQSVKPRTVSDVVSYAQGICAEIVHLKSFIQAKYQDKERGGKDEF